MNKIDIVDEEYGNILLSASFDSSMEDYPLQISFPSVEGEQIGRSFTVEEGKRLFKYLENLFEPCLKNV